jgi:hypothetical protein
MTKCHGMKGGRFSKSQIESAGSVQQRQRQNLITYLHVHAYIAIIERARKKSGVKNCYSIFSGSTQKKGNHECTALNAKHLLLPFAIFAFTLHIAERNERKMQQQQRQRDTLSNAKLQQHDATRAINIVCLYEHTENGQRAAARRRNAEACEQVYMRRALAGVAIACQH